jgi:putative ABC transport system substrate-binding protein
VRAQQPALPRIGSILPFAVENTEAFGQGLREAGYVDGQNIVLDTRYHHDSLERIDEFARELVASNAALSSSEVHMRSEP